MSAQKNPHTELLMEQFRQQRPTLELIEKQACTMLSKALSEQGVAINAIEHRIKTEESLEGKLERKGNKYQNINDITDLIGIRVITYYTDDVDKVAVIVKNLFTVDWQNSVDKRKLHQLNSFGYNSLHYVCSMPEGQYAQVKFEIQMRTALQHVWSAIEHDIGYKMTVKPPPELLRQFSRLAGMLELADDEFSRLRTTMTDYRRQIQSLVKNGHLDEVPLSADSFQSYLNTKPFERLNKRIAAVNQAELFHTSMMPFLPIIESFGMETLGDIQSFIEADSEDAYQLALSQLAISDMDIIADSVALYNLCIVHTLKQGKGMEGVLSIFNTLNSKGTSNETMAKSIMRKAQSLPFMQTVKSENGNM